MFDRATWGIDVIDAGYVHARSGAALALALLGDHDGARATALAELDDVRAFGAARPLGVTLRAVGLVHGGTEGIDFLRASVQSLHATSAVLERAHSHLALGAGLRRAGRRSEACDELGIALDLASQCGARPAVARARDELHIAGARPRRDRRTGVDALTPIERKVADLAADGRTNREIAQSLYVSLKTVEGHLSHVYAKLAITRRADLPAALDEKQG
jgi:DNA-binding NarL/FixJ family response regulator